MVLRSRAKKSSENSSQRNSVQSSRSIKHSKPSSVTTLYTASSANASHGQVRVLTKYEDSQPYQNNNAKYLMRSREIIEEINESINSSVADDMSRLQCFQNNLQSSDLDMSLISEIRSELDQSCNMSIDEQKAPIERSVLSFKCIKSSTVGQDQVYREFSCFHEPDVIKFINITPGVLPDSLAKGDNDEDTDSEDLERCTSYVNFELFKALKAETRFLNPDSFQNID